MVLSTQKMSSVAARRRRGGRDGRFVGRSYDKGVKMSVLLFANIYAFYTFTLLTLSWFIDSDNLTRALHIL